MKIGLALGGIDFSDQSFTLGDAEVLWGAFVRATGSGAGCGAAVFTDVFGVVFKLPIVEAAPLEHNKTKGLAVPPPIRCAIILRFAAPSPRCHEDPCPRL